MADTLKKYREKRNFAITSEPEAGGEPSASARAFVIQKHWATRLHYDFRLELDGAMKSWAVPKGPSYDPSVKRMAVQVEDHPIAYNQFEGEIPKGQYGAGKVIIWDEGTWTPVGDPRKGYRAGHLKFDLNGVKMQGRWALVRIRGAEEKQPPWLLIKDRDEYARSESEFDVVDEMPDSVVPLRGRRKRAADGQGNGRGNGRTKAASGPAAAASADAGKPARAAKTRAADEAPLPGEPAELPEILKPQLATLVEGVPHHTGDWTYEMKFDGYRLLARVVGKSVKLFTRNGHDWSARMPHLVKAIGKLGAQSAWIDGEIVVLADNGAPSFQALQNAFDNARTGDIVYYVFDLPFIAGRDLRREPLTVRRELLAQLMKGAKDEHVRFSESFDVAPADLVSSACKMGLEGIIAKRRDAPYVSRRAETWVKIKCARRQEFVIAGYTDPKGGRKGFGSLLLAVHDDNGALRYAGNVGSGFDERGLLDLKKRLDRIAAGKSPLEAGSDIPRRAHWVKPTLVAEVSFGEWTNSGHVRHAVFRGLRQDKPARAVTREVGVSAAKAEQDAAAEGVGKEKDRASDAVKGGKTAAAKSGRRNAKAQSHDSSGAADEGQEEHGAASELPSRGRGAPAAGRTRLGKLSNPDRVIDPSTGLTKLDLARYYGLVAPLLLPHLKGRPVSFVRAPSGIQGELFFQKHLEAAMPGVKPLPERLYPDHPALLEVPSADAIMSAAQMNVVEFHTWNAVKTAIDKPDRMLFDLDPGEGVQWPAMLQAAELVHVLLQEMGLKAWLKTSGGKGLHVVVPVRKQYGWDTVKAFSGAIVKHLARTLPQVFVAKSGPKNRVGKVFVDYLRNGFGATTAAAWSARTRPGLGISVPVGWDELPKLKSGAQWTIANVHTRLDVANAPWDDYKPQPIGRAMAAIGFEPGA
ncbi:DNA ligase D [Bordetella genomosp. 9]|uniref:DNA ligase D n=1 Tax=Bordetella genomosp. 9 TaxID=1416803 RepID=UPI000A2901F8|nr:DNA ligase D [Bordetella genomosp. 9]ARP90706.1 DNA ligase D [Bordetella genomosp. 9]